MSETAGLNKRMKYEVGELGKLKDSHGIKFDFGANQRDMMCLIVTMPGPKKSSYEGIVLELKVYIGKKYPFVPAMYEFITPVYHPNIATDGTICLDILYSQKTHTGAWSLAVMIKHIYDLLQWPNLHDPLRSDVANLFKHDRTAFTEKVHEAIRLGTSVLRLTNHPIASMKSSLMHMQVEQEKLKGKNGSGDQFKDDKPLDIEMGIIIKNNIPVGKDMANTNKVEQNAASVGAVGAVAIKPFMNYVATDQGAAAVAVANSQTTKFEDWQNVFSTKALFTEVNEIASTMTPKISKMSYKNAAMNVTGNVATTIKKTTTNTTTTTTTTTANIAIANELPVCTESPKQQLKMDIE